MDVRVLAGGDGRGEFADRAVDLPARLEHPTASAKSTDTCGPSGCARSSWCYRVFYQFSFNANWNWRGS
jgi:hypothetical protein